MGGKACNKCPLSNQGKMPVSGCYKTQEWVDDIVTDHCPVMDVNNYAFIFHAYRWAKRGFLPGNKSWDQQPIQLIDALDSLYNEEEKATIAAQRNTEN